jgi:hypothetical protein
MKVADPYTLRSHPANLGIDLAPHIFRRYSLSNITFHECAWISVEEAMLVQRGWYSIDR